jgi:hypothetical protein
MDTQNLQEIINSVITKVVDEYEFTTVIAMCEIDKKMKEFGYTRKGITSDGWDFDFWVEYHKDNENLMFSGTWWKGTLFLSLVDEEE